MKIAHPTPQIPPRDSHGGPKGPAQAGSGDTTTTGGTTSSDPVVNVDLSADAQGIIAAGKGNSANSPAHQARNYFASLSGTEGFKNFGQLVSQIAHGIFPGEAAPAGDETPTDVTDPVIDETGSTAPIDDGATADAPAVIDEPVVVDEPVAEEPVIVVDEPVVEEPVVIDEPIVVVDEPVAEEPVAEEPAIVVDEPVAEEPVIVADEPIVTVEEPVVTDAELIDALTTDTTEPA
ncbi:MAG: hypothetical protein IIA36_07830 [Proteobacteria bacterium]|nr:hypothetical protein [Pseudomonadota bacterium]